MTRFQRIDTDKTLMLAFVQTLINLNYKEIQNFNGGDNDFLMIDTLKKEYIWCENGFHPFCSDESMYDYEFNKTPDLINLKDLYFIRF